MGWPFSSPVARSKNDLDRQLKDLSRAYRHLWIDDSNRFVIVEGIKLPPGYNQSQTELLIELPGDYPCSPPGVGSSHVYVPHGLRYKDKRVRDIHEYSQPSFRTEGFGPWAWWCYESITWDPFRDNLIKFVEMVRANMTDPPTE
jgi:hypothetical protein